MSAGSSVAATSGGAAAYAAMIEATKASGVIVRVAPADFLSLLDINPEPIVVHATGGLFSTHHQYLTSFRGLEFFTKQGDPLTLPEHCVRVEAKKIWIPG